MRVRHLIDVPDLSFFLSVLIRIPNKICKGTPTRIKDPIDAPSWMFIRVS